MNAIQIRNQELQEVAFVIFPLAVMYGTPLGELGEIGKVSAGDRSFLNLKDDFMRFEVEVENGVYRQCQNDFPLAVHLGGISSTLHDFGQFLTLKKH